MKKTMQQYRFTLFVLFFAHLTFSQTTIWSEDFDGNGGGGSNWGVLNQSIGVQGMTLNQWYISCQESGNAAGVCGSGCGADNSLHLGSTSVGDLGAAYDASSLCLPGCFLCDFIAFCSDVTTNRRSQSANISTLGQTNLTLNFNYIENGQGPTDNCVVEYSIDGGTSWIQLGDPAKTTICVSGQALWTAQSYALPITTEGIANLRIAYRWQNNADGLGADPSFAVDDITITTPTPLPIELFSFYGEVRNDFNLIKWSTASEINNDYFSLERSKDAITWEDLAKLDGAGTSVNTIYYQYQDRITAKQNYYYRLKQVDFDGKYSYSDVIAISNKSNVDYIAYPNPVKEQLTIVGSSLERKNEVIKLINIAGEVVLNESVNSNLFTLSLTNIRPGIYTLLILRDNEIVFRQKVIKL